MVDYRISLGHSFDFFQKVSVTRTTFGSLSDGYIQDLVIPFSTQALVFLNEGTGTVEFSFNGFDIHGELDSTNVNTKVLSFNNRRVCKIWFRVKSGSSGPIIVSTTSWGIP